MRIVQTLVSQLAKATELGDVFVIGLGYLRQWIRELAF